MSGADSVGQPRFLGEFYEVDSFEAAKALTVTSEPGTSTEERWRLETPYLVEDLTRHLAPGPEALVLDYGCGTGRVSKALIEATGCRVAGVDASAAMRDLAPGYVLSERFTVWSPDVLDAMIARGFRADAAMCNWVIQHAFNPMEVIRRLVGVLRPGGQLYVVNGLVRCVPTTHGYVDDGFDVQGALRKTFEELDGHAFPVGVTTPQIAANSLIQVLRKRA